MLPNEARRAIERVSLETQRDLLDQLRADVAALRADSRLSESTWGADNSDLATAVRSRTDRLAAEAVEAAARITDDQLRSELQSDVIDVVAAIRRSQAHPESSVATTSPAAPPLPASFLSQGSRRR